MPTIQNTEKVYQAIRACVQARGFAPSLREICAATDLSMQVVRLCLRRLEAQGRIRRQAGTARGIVLLDADKG